LIENEGKLELKWQLRAERKSWQRAREGAYLLRTNLPATRSNRGRAVFN
jgi:hypothetical protein